MLATMVPRRLLSQRSPIPPVDRLVKGFQRFHKEVFSNVEKRTLFEKLALGQSPKTLMVGCADSRVDPAIITELGPGEVFMLRNIAAIVPPFGIPISGSHHGTSAGLEYGVRVLEVENIVIMGHAKCGGVAALGDPDSIAHWNFHFVNDWVRLVTPAFRAVDDVFTSASAGKLEGLKGGAADGARIITPDLRPASLEKTVVMTSLMHLLTYPFIKERVEAGKLKLHGWYFDLPNGQLMGFDPSNQRFRPLTEDVEIQDSGKVFLQGGEHAPLYDTFLDMVRKTIVNDCQHHHETCRRV